MRLLVVEDENDMNHILVNKLERKDIMLTAVLMEIQRWII